MRSICRADAVTTGISSRARLAVYASAALAEMLFLYTALGARVEHPVLRPYVQGAILLLLASWWGWRVVRQEPLPHSPLAAPLLAVIGAAAVSTCFSVDPRLSATGLLHSPSLVDTVSLVLFFLVFCDLLLLGWSGKTFVDALLTLAGLLLGQGLWVTANWYWGWWQLRVPEYPPFLLPFRLFGVADWPTQLAALINLALPFAILRLAKARRPSVRVVYALWLAAADVLLFFTRARAGWVAATVVIALSVGWLLLPSGLPRPGRLGFWLRRTWRLWAVGLGYLALFVLLLVASARLSPSEYSTNGGSVATIGGRTTMWDIAWGNFLKHPVTGSGVGTYTRVYVDTLPATRWWTAPHAHNLFLGTLTEQGIIGLLALGWVIFGGARALWGARRPLLGLGERVESERPALLAGASVALVGYLTHAQADMPTFQPTNALLVVMLAATAMWAAGALEKRKWPLSRWAALMIVGPVIVGAVLIRQSAALGVLFEGLHHELKRDWQTAARMMDTATAADPAVALYHAQRGFAYGVLAEPLQGEGDPAALRVALDSYAVALRMGPDRVPDLLNAAWLLERAGAGEEAEQLLERAVRHGADWALPALLLADRHAARGELPEAEKLYAAAFRAEPQARDMVACRRILTCREAAQRLPADETALIHAHEQVQVLLGKGQPREALEVLRAVPLVSAHPLPWIDRANAHLALGELAQAHYALRLADTLGGSLFPHTASHYALAHARLDLAEGQPEDAVAALERAVSHSPSPIDALLPRLDMLQGTSDELAVYRELAQIYAQEGRPQDAAWVREQAEVLAALLGASAQAPDK